MKYLLLSLLLLPLGLMAQKKYAPLNAVWHYGAHNFDCNGNFMTYKVEQETIIDGKGCSIIYCYTGTLEQPDFVQSSDSLIVWENENKVYFLEGESFYLLYDFTAEQGDTVTYYDPINRDRFSSNINNSPENGPKSFSILITAIDIQPIAGVDRKFFHTQQLVDELDFDLCSEQGIIIEHIGSNNEGLTGGYCYNVEKGCSGGLQCYSNAEIDYIEGVAGWFEIPHPDCDIIDSSSDINHSNMITIFPNPVSNDLFVESTLPIRNIKVYNSNQQLLKTNYSATTISMDNLAQGLYFIGIETAEGVKYFKVVKENF